jgi:PKHD-type hydroxylase
MYTLLSGVLPVKDVARIRDLVLSASFVDGRETSLLATKNNQQLPVNSETAAKAGALLVQHLCAHDDFNLAVYPAAIHPPLFSRYEPGMGYPDHVDVSVMGGIRTDVALTLFLSEPESYAGGELVVNTGNGLRRFRLNAGDAIAYPASTIHQVAPVTRGTRLAAVCWVQSLVRDPLRRQILKDLGLAMRNFADSACGPRLTRSYWNLLRLWAEPIPAGPEPRRGAEH